MGRPCPEKFLLGSGATLPCVLPRGHGGWHAIQAHLPDQGVRPPSPPVPSTPAEQPINQKALLASTDPMVWAKGWCRVARRIRDEGRDVVDEPFMTGWFANAMEVAAHQAVHDLELEIARERIQAKHRAPVQEPQATPL